MPEYNFKEAHVFRVTNISTQAAFTAASAVDEANLDYIGLMRQETGYNISEEQVDKSSLSDEIVLTQKLEINLEVLWKLSQAEKDLLDSQIVALLLADPDYVTVSSDGNTVTVAGGSPTGTLLAPTRLYIKEEEKFGTGQVTPMVITGRNTKATKAELRKTVNLTAV